MQFSYLKYDFFLRLVNHFHFLLGDYKTNQDLLGITLITACEFSLFQNRLSDHTELGNKTLSQCLSIFEGIIHMEMNHFSKC
jgi:hypothetical protein